MGIGFGHVCTDTDARAGMDWFSMGFGHVSTDARAGMVFILFAYIATVGGVSTFGRLLT